MTEKDRKRLREEVQKLPKAPEAEGMNDSTWPSEEVEVREGFPGRLFHRCYYGWGGAVVMWMKAKRFEQPLAILDLAHKHDLVTEARYRRLSRDLGAREVRPVSKRPVWDREERVLRFEGTIVRRIRSLKVAANIVSILDGFQGRNWPARIDAPQDLVGQTLHDAVKSLNKGLRKISFHVDGDGQWITWRRR